MTCNVNARYFSFSEAYTVGLFSGTLDNHKLSKGHPTLQAWSEQGQGHWYSTDREGLLTQVKASYRPSDNTLLSYEAQYFINGEYANGHYNSNMESGSRSFLITPNPRRPYGWLNNITFTQGRSSNYNFRACGSGTCETSQAPWFIGLNMDSPFFDVNAPMPASMRTTLQTRGILVNISSSPEYMITQAQTGYYPYNMYLYSNTKFRPLSSILWRFRHWISATALFAGIQFPVIGSSNYAPYAVPQGNMALALAPPAHLNLCDTRDVFPRAAPAPVHPPLSFQSGLAVCGYELGSDCNQTNILPCCGGGQVCKRHASNPLCAGESSATRYRCSPDTPPVQDAPDPEPFVDIGPFTQSPSYSPCEVQLDAGEPGFPQCLKK